MTTSDPFLNFKFHQPRKSHRIRIIGVVGFLVFVFLIWNWASPRFFLLFVEVTFGVLLWLGFTGWRNVVSGMIDFLDRLIQ